MTSSARHRAARGGSQPPGDDSRSRVRVIWRPDKTSIREALGRALFHAQRYEQAAQEFEAVIDRAPTNDYALFCLGRSLQMLGRHAEARKPLALAACLQPGRRDYRLYRDRARARASDVGRLANAHYGAHDGPPEGRSPSAVAVLR